MGQGIMPNTVRESWQISFLKLSGNPVLLLLLLHSILRATCYQVIHLEKFSSYLYIKIKVTEKVLEASENIPIRWWSAFSWRSAVLFAWPLPCHSSAQTICLPSALSCVQPPSVPAVAETCFHISFYKSLFKVFFGCPDLLWPCDVHCGTCLAMLSPLLLSMSCLLWIFVN